jgi:UDP-glucose 4-epimerase
MSRILVTGGAGFIGSHVVRALLDRGDEVVVLDDLSSGRRENLPLAAVDLRLGDVREAAAAAAALAGCDGVVHLAAVVSVQRSVEDPGGTDAVTFGGTVRVLECAVAAGVERLVLASSCAVYGDGAELPILETAEPRPLSPYAASKLKAEQACIALRAQVGVVALRFFNVFGPRQDASSEYSGAIARFLSAAATGEDVTVYGDGRQTRDFVAVADVTSAVLLALDGAATGEAPVLNVGSGRETSVLDLVAACRDVTGAELPVRHAAPRGGDIVASRAAIGAAATRLGFTPRVSLVEGLRTTYEWYVRNWGR